MPDCSPLVPNRLSPSSATADTARVAMMVMPMPDVPVVILFDFTDGHASLTPAFIALPPAKPHRVQPFQQLVDTQRHYRHKHVVR